MDTDGILVAIKKDTFTIKEKNMIRYTKSNGQPENQFFFHFTLIHNNTKNIVELFTTHLKARPEFEA